MSYKEDVPGLGTSIDLSTKEDEPGLIGTSINLSTKEDEPGLGTSIDLFTN